MKNKIVTTIELADVLGLTDRRIRELVREGVIDRIDRGQYNLAECVQSYIKYKIDSISKREETGKLSEEQARLTKLKADREEIELKKLRGEVIPVYEIAKLWNYVITSAKTKLLSIPSIIKIQNPDIDISVINSIDTIHRECLEELAHDPLPNRYTGTIQADDDEVEVST
jgi:phage terminase Nu1 subunit (DNA packaging protein)